MTGRWTFRVSAAGVLLLAAAAFTLSYDALHQLALDSRVRPALAWLWPVVIDGTIVVALLTVLAAKRAATRAGYPWALAGLFSLASVAFNIAHAPDRPVAQLVFAMAPVALVLPPTCLCSRSAGAGRGPATPTPCPYTKPARNPHTRKRRATSPHPSWPLGSGRTGGGAGPCPGGLRNPGRRRPDPDRRWSGPSGRCERAVWATAARRVHRRPSPRRPPKRRPSRGRPPSPP